MDERRVRASYARYMRLKGRSEETIDLYERVWKLFRTTCSEALEDITRADVEEFLDLRRASVKDTTVARDWCCLSPFFAWAVREEYLERNPMKLIPMPGAGDTPPRVLSNEELGKLFRATQGTSYRQRRNHAILRLMSEVGGPRRSEICNLRMDDIDWSASLVTVSGKTGTRRLVFGDRTGAALERFMKVRDRMSWAGTEWLWLGKAPMGHNTLAYILKSTCDRAGIDPISAKILRHTAAHRAMDSKGLSTTDLQVAFGWKSAHMLNVYGRQLKESRSMNAIRRLGLSDQF
ncbi:tyrosine-type recombinase/integrase [Actinoplanes oblitus]|uniref:Tyrosine-type recombinase/integrase n=1 Tax=Actinoplanes oblitus TaxID=3040509 RepID=A0ABY8WU81_9ACTN|nr:tyrosine-type recombinase/integrase [Actinoplanes oblitus]WIM99405.1 tyrosine-type recombinase/integrase [Actinoplanes oblitus]